ncbi:MAG: quinol monooxygenase YgiN [Rhodothermales bacterium]|jgi:quinol monooxygenase YgiN
MSKVSYVVEFKIKEGGVDGFKQLAAGFISDVKASEMETVGYQWYLAEDGSRCLIHESFASSEALLVHLGNVGPDLPKLFEFSEIGRLEVFGPVTDEARGALDTLGAQYFPHMGGFDR